MSAASAVSAVRGDMGESVCKYFSQVCVADDGESCKSWSDGSCVADDFSRCRFVWDSNREFLFLFCFSLHFVHLNLFSFCFDIFPSLSRISLSFLAPCIAANDVLLHSDVMQPIFPIPFKMLN